MLSKEALTLIDSIFKGEGDSENTPAFFDMFNHFDKSERDVLLSYLSDTFSTKDSIQACVSLNLNLFEKSVP